MDPNNSFTALPDGSLIYDRPFEARSKCWKQDPENPYRYIPVVPECTSRKIELRTLNCGKQRATWRCGVFHNKKVSAKDCNECQVPTKP